jgi:Flp pilus assembly protein TadG
MVSWRIRATRYNERSSPALSCRNGFGRSDGQSLIEVALMLPLFTIMICYAVDFGYCFIVATALSSASRNSVEYAIQGASSPAQAAPPGAGAVSTLAIAGIGLADTSTGTVSVRVCSRSVGVTMPSNIAQCTTPSSGAGAITGLADVDPESPTFQLNRVDVSYTVTPIIPIPASIFPATTFHRMVEMRSMQ